MQTLAPILAVISSDAADLSGVPTSAPAGANTPAFGAAMAAAIADGQAVVAEATAPAADATTIAPVQDDDAALAALTNASAVATKGMTARLPAPDLIQLVVTTPPVVVSPAKAGAGAADAHDAPSLDIDGPVDTVKDAGDGPLASIDPSLIANPAHIAAAPAPDVHDVANGDPAETDVDHAALVDAATTPAAGQIDAAGLAPLHPAPMASAPFPQDAAMPEAPRPTDGTPVARMISIPAAAPKERVTTEDAETQSPQNVENDDRATPAERAPVTPTLVTPPPAPNVQHSDDDQPAQRPDIATPQPPTPPTAVTTIMPSPAAATPAVPSTRISRNGKSEDRSGPDDGANADDDAPDAAFASDAPAQPQLIVTNATAPTPPEAQALRIDVPRTRREPVVSTRMPTSESVVTAASTDAPSATPRPAPASAPQVDAAQAARALDLTVAPQAAAAETYAPEPTQAPALVVTMNTAEKATRAEPKPTADPLHDKLGALTKFGLSEIEITTAPASPVETPATPQPVLTEAPAPGARATSQEQAASGAQVPSAPSAADAERRSIAADMRVRAIERQVIAAARAGGDEVRMQLYPPGLGQVIIRLTMDGARLRLSTRTASQEATDALKEGEAGLRDALALGGFNLTDFDVSDQPADDKDRRRAAPETQIQPPAPAPAEAFAVDMNA